MKPNGNGSRHAILPGVIRLFRARRCVKGGSSFRGRKEGAKQNTHPGP